MENAPIVNKRRSLTLSNRLLQKRHSASPQSRACASATQEVGRDADNSLCESPKAKRIVDNVESTPPSKKMHSLDDSLDFSPHNLSPSFLLSQTLVTGSPEVGWRWNSESNGRTGDRVNTTSDSGFDSEEFGPGAFKQRDRRKQVRVDAANEHRRKQLDNKQRRAQQIRDHELLKERCNKLHKQLDQHSRELEQHSRELEQHSRELEQDVFEAPIELPAVAAAEPPPVGSDPALADFLNDSDTDCFLLEASQQLETGVVPAKQPVVTTPTSHNKAQNNKEKRASFYMKFLEDESETEDWFVALDEAMLEATQPKKQRTSLQRYKSMPSKTVADAGVSDVVVTAASSSGSATCTVVPGKSDTPRHIKRHASSHALSPAISSARGNLFGKRK